MSTARSATAIAIVALAGAAAASQEPCPVGMLFEPYAGICAAVNDRRDWWLEVSATSRAEPPEAGAINAGTTYRNGALVTSSSARLHTKMFVHPDGIQPAGFLDWTFTTATNRVDSAVEVVGIYRSALGDSGVLAIFGRPCSTDYPCPDGDTSNGWQPSKRLSELTCHITHIVDDGGHAQKIVHYANHSDRIDDGSPPMWTSAIYLWNYCNDAWDLIWRHEYREEKRDCSVDGCYWWGPGIELPGGELRPEVAEIGYQDSLLYHDGIWSELRPNETDFRRPEDRPDLSPWQLFHQDPNRAFGAGSFFDVNDPPTITAQQDVTADEDTEFVIGQEHLTIEDPDVDLRFHTSFSITVFGGDNYTHSETSIRPNKDYFGQLEIPVSVSDGAADSPTFTLVATITPVRDAPMISSMPPTQVTAGATYRYEVTTADPDGDFAAIEVLGAPRWLTIQDHGDGTATVSGTPGNADVGDRLVMIEAADSTGLTATQAFTLTVVAGNVVNKKKGGGAFSVWLLLALLLRSWIRVHIGNRCPAPWTDALPPDIRSDTLQIRKRDRGTPIRKADL